MIEPLVDLAKFLSDHDITLTRPEARRLIAGGAVSVNNKVVDSAFMREQDLEHALIQIGKHKMIQL